MHDKTASNIRDLMLLVAVSSLLLHIIYAYRLPVPVDEGAYLYDSLLVSKGLLPYRDFYGKSPLLTLMLSISVNFLGNTITAGRLLVIVFTILTSFVVYGIGKELLNKSVGFMAFSLHALSPFLMVFSTIVLAEPMSVLLTTLSMYFLLKGIKEDNKFYYVLNGFFIATSLLVRRSSLSYFIVFPVLILILKSDLKIEDRVKRIMFSLYGVLTISALLSPSVLVLGHKGVSNVIQSGLGREVTLYGTVSILSWESIMDKFTNLFNNIVFLLYLVFPTFLFLKLALERLLKLNERKSTLVVCLLYLFFLTLFYLNLHVTKKPMVDWWHITQFIALGVIIWGIQYPASAEVRQKQACVFLIIWLLGLSVFYLLWIKFRDHYITEFLPAACIVSAMGLHVILNSTKTRRVVKIMLVALILCSAIPTYWQLYDRSPKILLSNVHYISDYIKANTKKSDEIFTASGVYAYLSDRRIVSDTSHPIAEVDEIKIKELQRYLDERKIKYAIIDKYTSDVYFKDYPQFERYVLSNYKLVEAVSNETPEHLRVKIYELNDSI